MLDPLRNESADNHEMTLTLALSYGGQDRDWKRVMLNLANPAIKWLPEFGFTVSNITEDQTPGRRVHDPEHPQADGEGYVTYSNVNAVEEMVNMISASRSYQNNVEVMNTAKSLLLKTLQMGQ